MVGFLSPQFAIIPISTEDLGPISKAGMATLSFKNQGQTPTCLWVRICRADFLRSVLQVWRCGIDCGMNESQVPIEATWLTQKQLAYQSLLGGMGVSLPGS